MNTGINIEGSKAPSPEVFGAAAAAIVEVLRVGHDTRAEQSTIQKALDLLAGSLAAPPPSMVALTGATITHSPTTIITEADLEDVEEPGDLDEFYRSEF